MLNPVTVMAVLLAYVAVLFGIARWAERRSALAKRGFHPLFYAIALGVYCTSWTFYGSVGKAATSGFLFLTIYLGPTLFLVFGWVMLRRLVRLKNEHHITSIADFIALRYSHSGSLGIVVTLIALVGTIPYVALQLQSLTDTFQLISVPEQTGLAGVINNHVGGTLVLLMIVFTIVFGVRRLDPTERHTGMVAAVVAECVVKLAAFLAVGIFVTYFLHDGVLDIFQKAEASRIHEIEGGALGRTSFVTWTTYTLLAMGAFILLPRQFHIAVVENADERHIRTAQWVTPLYFLLISVFVMPIALSGLLQGYHAEQADTFVLSLPLQAGANWLSLFVFIGGFSAATAMIMVCSVTVATMMTNHILVPIVHRIPWLGGLRRRLLTCRWAAVALFIWAGYWFATRVGESYMLVNMGMMSFAAVFQFAPVFLGGLFWKKGTRVGAMAGLCTGFTVWAYTLILPAFARSGWAPMSVLESGPFGIWLLRPEHLLGLTGLDNLTHALCWSMFFNISGFIVGSHLTSRTRREEDIAAAFVDVATSSSIVYTTEAGRATVDLANKRGLILGLFEQYYNKAEAQAKTEEALAKLELSGDECVALLTFAELQNQIVHLLSGALGTAAAHDTVNKAGLLTDDERRQLSNAYAEVLADLRLSPEELRQRIDLHQEREAFLAEQSKRLEHEVHERTVELSTIIESNPVGILVVDSESLDIVRVNENVLKMGAYTRGELLGRRFSDIVEFKDASGQRGDEASVQELGGECWLVTAQKDRIPILKTSAKVMFGGRLCYLETLADITDRKRLEGQLAHAQKLESIGQMAAGIAHEINTPIQYVGDNIKFLSDSINDLLGLIGAYRGLLTECTSSSGDSEQKVTSLEDEADLAFLRDEIPKAIAQGLDGVARVSKIVLAMKGFSHPGAQDKAPENLNNAIQTTITVSRNEWKYVADVVTDLDPMLPPVPCLLGEFNQVILNLIVNAAHAIRDVVGDRGQEKGTITISTRLDGDWAEVRVADTGTGIPESHRDKIFGHFFTTKEVGLGTGQGLAIAYAVITEKHGGTITFETEEGKGTTFILRLPVGKGVSSTEEVLQDETEDSFR